MSLFRCRLSLFSQTGSLTVLKLVNSARPLVKEHRDPPVAACPALASILCGTIPVFCLWMLGTQTQLLLLIACTLVSPKTPGFNFAKVKTVPIVCLCRPTPLLPPLYPFPGFSHQIPCIAFWLTVGSVSKVRTLASSEIHDGLGSWHGDERSRPQ